jgi:hypothetical protein
MEPSAVSAEKPRAKGVYWSKRMKPLGIALVCIAVLYGLDAYWFDGLYFTAASHLLSQIFGSFR